MAATAVIPAQGITLSDAPDNNGKPLQCMRIEMSQEVIDELLQAARSEKKPQIFFGRQPMLRYGNKTHQLDASKENFPHELYQWQNVGKEDAQLQFAGLIKHSLSFQKAEEATAGADAALEALKNNLASVKREKEASRAIVDSSPQLLPGNGRSKNFKQRSLLNRPKALQSSSPRSLAGSPSMGPLLSPSMAGLTSQPHSQTDPKHEAIRHTIIHILAVEPERPFDLRRKVGNPGKEDFDAVVLRTASKSAVGDPLSLQDKAYKEIKPWDFKYQSDEERETAINNAVRAFDRMRVSRDDKLWQVLLPEEERGKGKCLSRLNLNSGATQKAATPGLTPKMLAKKATQAKKTEAKKQHKETTAAASDKAKTGKEGSTATPKTTVRKSQQEARPKKAEGDAKGGVGKAAATRTTGHAPSRSVNEGRPRSNTQNSLNNKPKNPSPLSASPPVNASDFDDDHPVHRTLSAASSPAKPRTTSAVNGVKRKAEDSGHKARKGEIANVSTKAPPASNGVNGVKRKADEVDFDRSNATPAKRLKQPETNGHTSTHSRVSHNSQYTPSSVGRHASSPTYDDDSTSPPISLSYRQTLDLAQKFKRYYERYEKLYVELSNARDPPSDQKKEELMKMHRKLEEMKRDIRTGAANHH